jgi:hypothetical protein
MLMLLPHSATSPAPQKAHRKFGWATAPIGAPSLRPLARLEAVSGSTEGGEPPSVDTAISYATRLAKRDFSRRMNASAVAIMMITISSAFSTSTSLTGITPFHFIGAAYQSGSRNSRHEIASYRGDEV